MDVFQLIFGILLIALGIGTFYYQAKNKSYSKGEKITDSQINITNAGILAIIGGIIFIIAAIKK